MINGFINGAIYALVALGFAIVYNTTRIFHIAYAVIYMIAPYFVYTFFAVLGFNLWIAAVLAIVLTIAVSLVMELIVYKPLSKRKSSGNVILISSIGLMIIVINLIALFYGNDTKILNREISGSLRIGNLIVTYSQLWQLGISALLISGFMFFLRFSKFGIKTRAMRDDETLCRVFALDTFKFRNYLFVLSALFAGAGGIVVAWDVGMDPYIGMPMLLNAIVALIIGGIGKFHAPVIGGFVIGILQSLVIWKFSANWMEGVTFALLIIFLVFRPQGFFGEKQRLV
ncbi:MAG: branched-chain amino acid ABC transporter permease [Bacteroidales bacterium]|nr:branched-chain amino acid ABC transporter permease [Bacteroidales bacterium]